MASSSPNIQINTANFCHGGIAGNYGSIDTSNASASFVIKNSSGSLITSYSISPNITQNTVIQSLEDVGPRGVTSRVNNFAYFSLIKTSTSGCYVQKWTISGSNLIEAQKFTYNTLGVDYFDCNELAVEHYQTSFSSAVTVTGTGSIIVSSSGTMTSGTILFFGNSTSPANTNAVEFVKVTAVSGTTVYITSTISGGALPPVYYYAVGNPITYYTNMYLFSNIGYNGDMDSGTLYKIDAYNGSIIERKYSAVYANLSASAWSQVYSSVGLVQTGGRNIYYIQPSDNYKIYRSQSILNVESDINTIIPVYDLLFDSTTVYRLQRKISLYDGTGVLSTTSWSTYNYHQDQVSPVFSNSIEVYTSRGLIYNGYDITYINAKVTDQFGFPVVGTTVTFSKTGDASGGFYNPGRLDTTTTGTNSSGIATMLYKSGYYDPNSINYDGFTVPITTRVNGYSTNNTTTGDLVYGYMNLEVRTRKVGYFNNLTQLTASGITNLNLTQVSGVRSNFYVQNKTKYSFPGGHWYNTSGSGLPGTDIDPANINPTKFIIQLANQTNTMSLLDVSATTTGLFYPSQRKQYSDSVQLSQLYVSRHTNTGHKSGANINQFYFVAEAIPANGSVKNPINTNLWLRLNPYAYSLNSGTLSFKIKEYSYDGETDWIEYAGTPYINVITYGSSPPYGVGITVNPPVDFHYGSTIFVNVVIYDSPVGQGIVPNKIGYNYSFKIIPDYKAPYIINEYPNRYSSNIDVDTDVSFDIMDSGAGVDISSLEMFIDSRVVHPTSTAVSGGYHVAYTPNRQYFYDSMVDVSVSVNDMSDYSNNMIDGWKFYTKASAGPLIDISNLSMLKCGNNIQRTLPTIEFDVFAIDYTGLDKNSIKVLSENGEPVIVKTPIIKRII